VIRVVCSGDWHADALTAGLPRHADVEVAVEEVVACALDQGHGVDRARLFIFLGDLADPDAPGAWAAAELACRTAARLSDAGVPSLWIVGNHCALEDGSGRSVLEPLRGASSARWTLARVCSVPELVRFPGLDVVALPYAARSHEYDPAAFVRELPESVGQEGRRVLFVGHLNLDGMLEGSETMEMARGRSTFWPVAEILARFGDRALMVGGHYHRRQVHRGVQIAGSLERLSFADGTTAPGYLVLELDEEEG
jgi:DNA repair exonuclease SbcCD nuclease subunit